VLSGFFDQYPANNDAYNATGIGWRKPMRMQ
jgi:hypothetical protein